MALADIVQMLQVQADKEIAEKQLEAQNQLALMQLMMEKEEKETQTTLAFLHDTMKDKRTEYNTALTSLDQFTHLDKADVTSGGERFRSDILQNGKLNMYAIQGNIDAYDSKLDSINEAKRELKRQQSDFHDLISTYYGENRILQDFEFEKMKKYGEQVLGWKYGSAGAKYELSQLGTPTERAVLAEERAYRMIENQKLDEYITSDMQLLQSLFIRDFEDPEAATADGATAEDKELISWEDFAELDQWSYVDKDGDQKTVHHHILEEVSSLLAGGDPELFVKKIKTYKGPAYDDVRHFLYNHPSTAPLMENLQIHTSKKRRLLDEAEGVETKDLQEMWHDLKSSHGRQFNIDDDFEILFRNMHNFTEADTRDINKMIATRWLDGDLEETYKQYVEWFFASGYGDPNMASTPPWIREKYDLPTVDEMRKMTYGSKWYEEEAHKRHWPTKDVPTDEHIVDFMNSLYGAGGGERLQGSYLERDEVDKDDTEVQVFEDEMMFFDMHSW